MNPQLIKAQVARALSGIRQALRGKVLRVSAGTRVMLAQVAGLAGETFQDAEVFQQAGLRSVPMAGSQVVVIPLNGASAHGIVISCANGALHVANMQEGETALFNEREGHFIHLKNGKVIRMEADVIELVATTKVLLQTPLVDATAKIQAAGEVQDAAGTMTAMRTAYNAHGGHHAPGSAPDHVM